VPELGEIRIRLDQMTERIISRLKDRSRFPRNATVYRPDGVPLTGRQGISFLDFALQGLEAYHSSLGRYEYPDQYPLFSGDPHGSDAIRDVRGVALPQLTIDIKEDLLAFHQETVERLCAKGEDPGTYGETVYVDADLLQLLNERINVGRYVADAKMTADPSLADVLADGTALAGRLTDSAREAALVARVREVARRYELDEDAAEAVFRWIIQETLKVEVAYLQGLAGR
jgi:monofunctional chorismate mutase